MRQFLLAGAAAYTAAANVQSVAAGAVGFFYQLAGVETVTATGVEIKNRGDLVLGRTSALGGPVILPIYKHDFSYAKGVYAAATKFVATVVIPTPTVKGTYAIILNKNGLGFNLRNKWTPDTYMKTDTQYTAAQLAQKLVDATNANTASHGLIATLATATITFTAVDFGQDYTIIPAEKLTGIVPTYTTRGIPAYGDATYVLDLANKAAADKGFEYTWTDNLSLLYPNYNQNPLAQPNATDVGYTIFTLRFAERRDMKTRDEVVHQIIQVAFPTGASGIATFETVCQTLSGVPYVAP